MTDWLDRFTGGVLDAASPWVPSLVVPDGDPEAPDFLHLDVIPLPEVFRNRGIYPTKTKGDKLARRFMFAHPDLYPGMVELEREYPGCIFYSDVFRSPAESEAAVRAGRGALRAGSSTHNGGGAADVAVDKTRARLRSFGITEMGKPRWKRELDAIFRERGMHCFRSDGKRGKEDWHYDVGGGGYRRGQAWLNRTFGAYWMHQMTTVHVQRMLGKLRLYQGELDGVAGPLTREALRLFQRAWRLPRTGRAGAKTRRVLAFVTAVKGRADQSVVVAA